MLHLAAMRDELESLVESTYLGMGEAITDGIALARQMYSPQETDDLVTMQNESDKAFPPALDAEVNDDSSKNAESAQFSGEVEAT